MSTSSSATAERPRELGDFEKWKDIHVDVKKIPRKPAHFFLQYEIHCDICIFISHITNICYDANQPGLIDACAIQVLEKSCLLKAAMSKTLSEHYVERYVFTTNVTGRHRGQKRKLRAGYRAPSLQRTCYVPSVSWTSWSSVIDLIFFIVERGIARFLCAIRVFTVRASSSSPRLPLRQISFLLRPPLLS